MLSTTTATAAPGPRRRGEGDRARHAFQGADKGAIGRVAGAVCAPAPSLPVLPAASPREDWQASLRELAATVEPTGNMPSIRGPVLTVLVQRYYEGNTPGLEQLASAHNVSLSSVSRANSLVTPWLRGARKTKPDIAPIQGIEQAAFARAEDILRSGGFIE